MALPAGIANAIFASMGQQDPLRRRGPGAQGYSPQRMQPLPQPGYGGAGQIGPFSPGLDPTGFESYQMPGQMPGPGGIGTAYFNPPQKKRPEMPPQVMDLMMQLAMKRADTQLLATPYGPMTDRAQMSQGPGALMELIAQLGLAGGGYGVR